jgi:hypothetical protein
VRDAVGIARILAVVVVLAGAAMLHAEPGALAGARSAASVGAALIDLGAVFGSDEEPDENEPDDDAATAARPVADQRSHTSLRVVLLSLVLGAMGGAVLATRLRRLREHVAARWHSR